jgi:hypothetical protein
MSDIKPAETDALDQAFGRITGLLPAMKDIPEDFKSSRNAWCEWQARWFYRGLQRYPVER